MPVRSGALSGLLHYVAAAAMAGIPVAVLTGLLTGHLLWGVCVGLGSLVVCALSLLAHAACEYGAVIERGSE